MSKPPKFDPRPFIDAVLDQRSERRREGGHRRQPLRMAAMIHRVSGLSLALFLPFHFLTLGLAIKGQEKLDAYLTWTHLPLVKASQAILIALLVVHLLGGLRILAIEFLPWRGDYKRVAMASFVIAFLAGLVFLLRAA